jgi:hypothetical protein
MDLRRTTEVEAEADLIKAEVSLREDKIIGKIKSPSPKIHTRLNPRSHIDAASTRSKICQKRGRS